MTKQDFLTQLEDVLEADGGTITGAELLAELDGWDSLAVVSFIARIDELFDVTLSPEKIARSKSVSDLIALLGDKIGG